MSSSTDPWQPLEKKYRITRGILKAMLDSPPDQLVLQTHSAMARDDLDLIAELAQQCDLRFHISIESDRDILPGLPSAPSAVSARIDLLAVFSQAGINSVACVSPLFPIRDPDAFFSKLAGTGATAVVIDHFIGGDGSVDGSRTRKTQLPTAMQAVEPASVYLSYRDRIADIAGAYLPVGVSTAGFAGKYSACRTRPDILNP